MTERNNMYFLRLLDLNEVKDCVKGIRKAKFINGSITQPIKNSKKNTESLGIPDNVRKILTDKIYDTHYTDSVYCPNRVSVNFYNKYVEGDFYDIHVDSFKARPKSNNIYFDYGFSVNLSDNYEGGEFVLQTPLGNIERKLSSGEAVIFPIIYPHGVKRITKGERENIIGWLSSNVTYEQSFLLHTMYEVNTYLMDQNKEMYLKSTLIQTYLKKEWGK